MRKRLLLYGLCVIVFFILMMFTDNNFIQHVSLLVDISNANDITCYEKPQAPDSLPNFDPELADEPATDRNIFFHETSCSDENGLVLNARQACAVESAAKMNPNMNVYLLFLSAAKISNQSKRLFNQLKSYPNVRIRHIYPLEYVKNTPLESWYKSGELKRSYWPTSHMSDILRYLTLWKYGGIYLDLDVVITTSLEELKNFAGAEDWEHVGAGAVGFDGSELGRRMADTCIRDVRTNFRGDVWGNNGPGVITRELQKLCSTKYIREMTTVRCRGFKVFSPSVFYPIHYKKWKMYFESQDRNTTMEIVKKARAIHVWNKLSRYEEVRVDSEVPYAIIARKYCPRIFNNCGKVF